MWLGQDAYVVGGGPSLRHFDWALIKGKNTIGCNSAYTLGADIIKITIFGDWEWWKRIGLKGTESYGGVVVGCSPRLLKKQDPCPWLLYMERYFTVGLGKDTLGFHGNTGALAVNLALILGATKIHLLGFDMKMGPDRSPNWHDLRYEPGNPESYPHFIREFRWVERTLPQVFPGAEIINVTDDSDLPYFPKVSLESHFNLKAAEVSK